MDQGRAGNVGPRGHRRRERQLGAGERAGGGADAAAGFRPCGEKRWDGIKADGEHQASVPLANNATSLMAAVHFGPWR